MPYFIQVGERDEKFLETCSDISDAQSYRTKLWGTFPTCRKMGTLETCPTVLSPCSNRIAVLTGCKDGLAKISDEARCDPIDRIASDCFRYRYIFRGEDEALRVIRFFVDESTISYGVLRVLYVDVIEGKQIRRLDPPPSTTG